MNANALNGVIAIVKPPKQPTTTLDQLFCLYDEPFVKLAYETVLNRPADADGLQNYSAQLRRGVDRSQILVELASSSEGRRAGIDVPGLDRLAARHGTGHLSWVGRLANRIGRALSASVLLRIRIVENEVHAAGYRTARQLDHIEAMLTDMHPGQFSSRATALSGKQAFQSHADRLSEGLLASPSKSMSRQSARIAARLGAALSAKGARS